MFLLGDVTLSQVVHEEFPTTVAAAWVVGLLCALLMWRSRLALLSKAFPQTVQERMVTVSVSDWGRDWGMAVDSKRVCCTPT